MHILTNDISHALVEIVVGESLQRGLEPRMVQGKVSPRISYTLEVEDFDCFLLLVDFPQDKSY